MYPAALLFDVDGTITGPELLPFIINQTIGEAVTENGIQYDQHKFRHVFETHKGGGIAKYYAKYCETLSDAEADKILSKTSPTEMNERVVEKYVETLSAVTQGGTCDYFNIRSGITDVMRHAQEQGTKIGIVTNADHRIAKANIAAAGLYVDEFNGNCETPIKVDAFWNVDDCIDIPTQKKPSGWLYQQACKEMNVDPKFTIGFEDSQNGMRALRHANVNTRLYMHDTPYVDYMAFNHVENGDEKIIPAHLAVGSDDLSISFYENEILPVYNNRLSNAFNHSVNLRNQHHLPEADPVHWHKEKGVYRPKPRDLQRPSKLGLAL